jgi:putative hemolysin
MKRIFTFIIMLMALTACVTPQTQPVVAPVSTELPQANMPNPASVYCKQQGYKSEIRTAVDGSQSGVCIFSDAPTERIADWWGVIKSTDPGAQYDDYFERQDLGQVIYFGIDSMDPAVKSQIEALRDSGRIVHLYGTLVSNVPDYNGSQLLVDRIEVEE